MNAIKTLFKTFGFGLLIGLLASIWCAFIAGPIVGVILLASTIGYWFIPLLAIAIIWAIAVTVTAIRYLIKYLEKRDI